MKRNALITLWIALGVATAAQAETTITFDPRPAGTRVGIEGYTEGGMVFDDALSPGSVIAPDTGGTPSNGTAFLSKCGMCRPSVQASEGGLFDLLALDLGEHLFFGSGPFPTTVNVTGTREDGSTAVVSLVTDGSPGFETFLFDGTFRDLVRVEFTTSLFSGIGIDDLVVAVGAAKPELFVSPPSGVFVATQSFDLVLITRGSDGARLLDATLDGADFSPELDECGVAGSLEMEPGTTLRCPLAPEVLDAGAHVFEATVELEDGSTASSSVAWEVLGAFETP